MDPNIAATTSVVNTKCAKCGDDLKSNNEFTCHDDRRVCGVCWKKYLEHIALFFKK